MKLQAVAVLALLSVACTPSAAPPSPKSITTSAPALMTIDVQRDWAFKPDPSGQGDWSSPVLDDRAWDVLDTGDFWQKQGYNGYSGVAWYRRWVDVPSTWNGRTAYLVTGGVNDEYQVYVDGQKQGQAGSLDPGASAILHATSTPVGLTAGKRNLLAIQVRSAHNFGGIAKAPLLLSTQNAVPTSAIDNAVAYAKAHPEGLWPNWMLGQGRAWTVTGLPDGGPESLVGPDGSWEPTAQAPSVSAWLIEGGQVVRPPSVALNLADGHLPIVHSASSSGGLSLAADLWQTAAGGAEPAAAQWQVRVGDEGPSRDVSLVVALRPYQVQPGIAGLYDMEADGSTLRANGQPVLIAKDDPSRVVASTGEAGDLSVLAAAGQMPSTNVAQDG
ncbi:MAG: hypothetical protein JO247_16335, partial [Chloroflexi bacterium]|nr:hypothetical protein [Chloroflexota bacterium]